MLLASLLIIFMLLLVLGVPIAFSMLLSALAAVLLDGSFSSLLFIAQRMLYSIDSMSLLAVPLFIFAGELMGSGGITRRIMHFCNSLVGHVKGGMCHVSILACMIFAGVSGSSNADTAAVASITVPTMRKEGYDDDVAVSCVAAGGTIGPIIPPSTTLLIYATITGDSPGRLLMAGLLPGVLFGLSLMVVSSIYARKRNYPTRTRSSLREVGSSFLQAIPALLAPAIILAGISSGVFTATESGAIAALYGLIVGICYRELNWKEVIRALKNTAMSTGSIMFIIAAAAPFGWVLTRARFPDMLIGFITSISSSLAGTTIVIIAIMLLVGLFMEGMAAMMICIAAVDGRHGIRSYTIWYPFPAVHLNRRNYAPSGYLPVYRLRRHQHPYQSDWQNGVYLCPWNVDCYPDSGILPPADYPGSQSAVRPCVTAVTPAGT